MREQFTHAAWSELKTENARRTIPLPAAVRELLKARYAELNGNVVRLHPRGDQRTVFSNPDGGPVNYHNWRARRWTKLLEAPPPTRSIRTASPSRAASICFGTPTRRR